VSNFNDLLQILVSFFVEAGGQGVSRGGKSVMLAGLRKIGWAKGGGGGGGRIKSHRLGGHRMGSGFGGGGGGGLSNYNPKQDLKQRMQADFSRGRRSGSDIVKQKGGSQIPAHLHGRSSFTGADTLRGNSPSRWIRRNNPGANGMPRPRGFIKFK
jgi:hypothetical protein